MKKVVAGILAASMCLMMAACSSSSSSKAPETKAPETSAPETTAPETEAPETETPKTDTDYPKAPITVVVPYGAGGGTDLFARVIVDKMSEILGQPVEVVNKPGGGATIGATEVANAKPDGYTLGFSVSSPLILMPLYGETTYSFEDFQPICSAYSNSYVLCVSADSDIQTVDDLLEKIKADGGKFSYNTAGVGNYEHLTIEEWCQQLDIENLQTTNVPYTDGDSAQALALMSHEMEVGVLQMQGAKSYVEEGNIRVIMAFGDKCPQWIIDDGLDVPTTEELGYKCTISPIIGFYAPAGIDESVITAIDNAYAQTIQDEEVLKAIANIGLEIDYRQVDEYTQMLEDGRPVMEELLKGLGMIE
ncbi:MAG: tripartite tricarboxylate transporter substrate binding protein [Lachnospiraceae bacterium]|nr:tripartite tricarboxylate transporter substrate binding protein [Lachnospiraceae bacterium]